MWGAENYYLQLPQAFDDRWFYIVWQAFTSWIPRILIGDTWKERLSNNVIIASSSKALPYFRRLDSIASSDGTEIVAMEMGFKDTLLHEYLDHDAVFLGLAAGLMLMWTYTNAVFITTMTVIYLH